MIKQISQWELDQFLPHRFAIRRFIGGEVECFADRLGNIVGITAKGMPNGNWGYAVLRREESGKYRFWDLKTGIENYDAARHLMVRAMLATQPRGQSCSPLVD
jgi:hypothetical protein